ncbi:MAG TPA: MFS transporter [Dehalococcoidales bacterium]|nr:MFS transporter [Dehalococcoidales bacterium]
MKKFLVFGITSLSFLLIAISGTSVTVAFPQITSSFNSSLILAGWVLGIVQLTATATMPLGGKAGEIFGAKRVYMASLLSFIIGSLVCALAPSIEILIFGRFLQAIGSGCVLPVATVIVTDAFPDNRQQAIGFFTSIMPIGNIIGPNIGGWMVQSFGWRSVFWLNIPLGIIVFIISLLMLKAKKGEGGHLDIVGTGFFTGSLSSFLIALSTFGDIKSGGPVWLPPVLLVLAVIFMVAFIRRENRVKNPIIDLELIKAKPFLAANAFNLFYGMAVLGVMSFIPLFATSVYGMSTLGSGLIITPRSAGMLLGSIVCSLNLPKWGYRAPMLAGTATIICCLLVLGLEPQDFTLWSLNVSSTVILAILMFFAGAGMGVVAPAANNACIDLIPERIGMITGLRGMFRQTGSAISIAVTAVVLENFSQMTRGFTVVFFGLAVILLATAPTVFGMPKRANDTIAGEVAEETPRAAT